MRRAVLLLLLSLLAATAAPARAADRPNVVLVLTDDVSWDLVRTMPEVRRMQGEGLTLTRFFVTDSLCCPSRASILTGRFPHNTGVRTNVGRQGGYGAFARAGGPARSFAVTLEDAGYRTGFSGKYLNGYPAGAGAPDPGWTDFFGGGSGYAGFGYRWNDNGTAVSPAEFVTDAISARGQAFVHAAADDPRPFFLELSTFAAHHPYAAAPQDADRFRHAPLPRGGAFDAPVSDPPGWLGRRRALDGVDLRELRSTYRRRARSLVAVDRMLRDVRTAIAGEGLTDDTYVVFTSDNGHHLGDHRLTTGKGTAYDHDIRVPFVVVGPRVPVGGRSRVLSGAVDLASTFAALAGADAPDRDGRSLAGVWHGRSPRDWRTGLLVEHRGLTGIEADPDDQAWREGRPGIYRALRATDALYVEYVTGDRELYDLRTDPFELDNLAATVDLRPWHEALQRYRRCAGARSCRRAGAAVPQNVNDS